MKNRVLILCMFMAVCLAGCGKTAQQDTSDIVAATSSDDEILNSSSGDMHDDMLWEVAAQAGDDPQKVIDEHCELLEDSVKKITSDKDEIYSYKYKGDGFSVSFDIKGFEESSDTGLQFVKVYQAGNDLYLAFMYQDDEENMYGQVYKYK